MFAFYGRTFNWLQQWALAPAAILAPHKSLWVCACCRYEISETNLRSITGSHWHPHWRSTRGLWKAKWGSNGGDVGIHSSQSTSCKQYSTDTFCEYRIIEYRLQCRYACRGETAILQVGGRRSELDASGDIVLCLSRLNLSVRAYHRILKFARTIADLAGIRDIQSAYLAEALR